MGLNVSFEQHNGFLGFLLASLQQDHHEELYIIQYGDFVLGVTSKDNNCADCKAFEGTNGWFQTPYWYKPWQIW